MLESVGKCVVSGKCEMKCVKGVENMKEEGCVGKYVIDKKCINI